MKRQLLFKLSFSIVLVLAVWSTAKNLTGTSLELSSKSISSARSPSGSDQLSQDDTTAASTTNQTHDRRYSQNRPYETALLCLEQSIRVAGTIHSNEQKLALIAQYGKSQTFFKIGSKIPCGFSIEKIRQESILVSHEKTKFKLWLNSNGVDNSLVHSGPSTPVSISRSGSQEASSVERPGETNHPSQSEYANLPRTLYPFPERGMPGWIRIAGPGQYNIDHRTLKKLLNSSRMSKQARFITDSDGIYFLEVMPGGVYEILGLRTSDLIQSVNGQKVDSLYSTIASIRNTKTDQAIDIQILRNGNIEYLHYNLEN